MTRATPTEDIPLFRETLIVDAGQCRRRTRAAIEVLTMHAYVEAFPNDPIARAYLTKIWDNYVDMKGFEGKRR